MTVTSYYPMIFTKDLDAALKEYTEVLGFERKHTVENEILKYHVLDLNGNRVDIFTSENEAIKNSREGFYGMRVNAHEFEEGLEFYKQKGFKVINGPMYGRDCDIATLVNDAGSIVFLYHHIRKEERQQD